MGLQGGFISFLPKATQCLVLMLDLASVSVCLSVGFIPLPLAGPEQGFPCVIWTFLLPAVVLPSPSLWSELRLSSSTICVPVPSWPCPCCPLGHKATCAPSSLAFPAAKPDSCFGSAQGWGWQAPPVPMCQLSVAWASR